MKTGCTCFPISINTVKYKKIIVRTPLKLTQNHKSRGTKKCLARFKPLLTQTVAG